MAIRQIDTSALLSAVEQTAHNEIKKINIPVSHYLYEVKQLMRWCETDKTQLAKCSLTETFFDETKFLLNKAEEAQLKWVNVQEAVSDEAINWNKRKIAAKELHTLLMRSFRYAFRNDDTLTKALKAMSKNSKAYPIIIQELADLALWGESNIDLLKAISFDLSYLDKARSDHKKLSQSLAKRNAATGYSDSIKTERNKVLSALKTRVDEIRQAGKYIFANKPERLKGYCSAYIKRKNNKYQAKVLKE